MKQTLLVTLFSVIIFITFLCNTSYSQELQNPVGYVNDFANVLTTSEKNQLDTLLISYEKTTTIEIIVITVESLNGKNIEEYTNDIVKKWQVGKKSKNNGFIILNSIKDRQYRIQIGDGLKKYISEEYLTQLANNYLVPNLKQGNYFNAYKLTIQHTMEKINSKTSTISEKSHTTSIWFVVMVISILLIVIFLVIILINKLWKSWLKSQQ